MNKKRFRVYGVIAATTTSVRVEAEDKDQAIQKAEHRLDVPTLCNSCSEHLEMGELIRVEAEEV